MWEAIEYVEIESVGVVSKFQFDPGNSGEKSHYMYVDSTEIPIYFILFIYKLCARKSVSCSRSPVATIGDFHEFRLLAWNKGFYFNNGKKNYRRGNREDTNFSPYIEFPTALIPSVP